MRCFIAIEIPAVIRRDLRAFALGLRAEYPNLRVPAEDTIHLTLRFLGELPPDRVERAGAALTGALAGSGGAEATLSGLGVFPERGPARILWTGAACGDRLEAWRGAAEVAAAAAGLPPEKQAFRPHVTIGRFRDGLARTEAATLVARADTLRPCAFAVSAVSLWSSDLNAGGPRHTKLKDIGL